MFMEFFWSKIHIIRWPFRFHRGSNSSLWWLHRSILTMASGRKEEESSAGRPEKCGHGWISVAFPCAPCMVYRDSPHGGFHRD